MPVQDSRANGSGRWRTEGVSTTGVSLGASLALPDTNSGTLDGVLAARRASVAGVLGDFHLLDAETVLEGWG